MKDYYGKDASRLTRKKLFLFDMDGTIYRENDLFDGVIELLQKIRARGGKYVFVTNNPSKSVKDYVKKLRRMGIKEVTEEDFFTSSQAAIMLFKEKFANDLVYAQGTKSFVKELRKSGLNVSTKPHACAKAVLVAFDPEVTGKKLRGTCEMLSKYDVAYYATNPDWVCPVEFGAIPDCGSMCFGIEKATGKKPMYIGKPQPAMILEAMKKFGCSAEETVVFGDRLYTDVASGLNAGVDAVCVLSGEATIDDVAASEQKPTFVLNCVADLAAEW